MRVQSVRDVHYPIVCDAIYHPAFLRAAMWRISRNVSSSFGAYITNAMMNRAASTVYAIVLEYNGQPMYTIQNIANSKITTAFRRILRVQITSL